MTLHHVLAITTRHLHGAADVAVHRTSGAIFAQQMEIAGLSDNLKDLIDIVYVDAPNTSSGPLPPDVPVDIFKGPYYEW